jgi:RNA polymerase sigma-70 factor (ECF subfamily)
MDNEGVFVPHPHTEFDQEWAVIVTAHRPWLRSYLRSRVPEDAVEDVMQEVWASFWAMRDRYQEDGRVAGYLRRLADRRSADWHRAHARLRPGRRLAAPRNGLDLDLAATLLRDLGIRPATLIWQRVIEDRSLPELAEAWNLPIGTVKSRLHYEGRKLRRLLADWYRERSHDPACVGLRGEILQVPACEVCAPSRRIWRELQAKSSAVDWFQASSCTVTSGLGLWLDCIGSLSRGIREDLLVWSGPRELGTVRRLRNGWGDDITQRARLRRHQSREWWTYTLHPGDGYGVAITHYTEPAGAEALELVRHWRRGFVVRLPVNYPSDGSGDGSIVIQLPQNAVLLSADPRPAYAARIHGRPVVMWSNAAMLPHFPVIEARWV